MRGNLAALKPTPFCGFNETGKAVFSGSSFSKSWFHAWQFGKAKLPKRPDTSVLPMQKQMYLGLLAAPKPTPFTGSMRGNLAKPNCPRDRLSRSQASPFLPGSPPFSPGASPFLPGSSPLQKGSPRGRSGFCPEEKRANPENRNSPIKHPGLVFSK